MDHPMPVDRHQLIRAWRDAERNAQEHGGVYIVYREIDKRKNRQVARVTRLEWFEEDPECADAHIIGIVGGKERQS